MIYILLYFRLVAISYSSGTKTTQNKMNIYHMFIRMEHIILLLKLILFVAFNLINDFLMGSSIYSACSLPVEEQDFLESLFLVAVPQSLSLALLIYFLNFQTFPWFDKVLREPDFIRSNASFNPVVFQFFGTSISNYTQPITSQWHHMIPSNF